MSEADWVGIVAAGAYVPAAKLSSADIAEATGIPEAVIREKFGIHQKPLPGPDDHTNAMGLFAARDALERAGIDASEIDLVLCTTEEWKEYPLWTAGIKLAYDLGADRAWAIDVQQRCGTTMAAIEMARAMMLASPGIETVLIAGGYRNCDYVDFSNPRARFLTNLSAGGGALILRRGHAKNRVLGSAVITDGSFSLDVVVPKGGTVDPRFDEPLGTGGRALDVTDPEGMKDRLDKKSMANFLAVVDQALARSPSAGPGSAALTRADIDFLNILHMKRSAHRYVLGELGMREDQTFYLEDYGHIGQQDQPLVCVEAERRGLLKDGDLMVMVAAGIGYAWSASVIRWGPVS
ncbi:3-oxoacyl-ACP synthase [Pseudenhygromyxa sp. WMMC2535]|uniref:3-oxoacyl-ACP synthase n=1 Tax=Pseudenhygromyxa sp. WMMC2535 TaxID=2712867 RepID=UPI001557C7E3|nr:3-oxoacyl-ACP synthase [Pseudenhygromyxa sp. WMMC2535]NVB43315.1 3-oxoacyl-ACP synthase [Pseudenhygromyxa sp. WMMC2535]